MLCDAVQPHTVPPGLAAFVVLCVFLLLPMCIVVVVSFFDYNDFQIIPAFEFINFVDALGSQVSRESDLNTLRYTAVVWAITTVLRSLMCLPSKTAAARLQMVLFLVGTVPFLRSNIIRAIFWMPFLAARGCRTAPC